ncbi:MAG TPA: hypothetical protein VG843_12445 [Rhizomicrobium sp.]|jgi:hypothetical protein|nr:hypothetical protein [Rhizomicrobium sp.]
MTRERIRAADGFVHSRPGSVDQQMEDTFPASDAPSFSQGAIGAPANRKSKPPSGSSRRVLSAEKKLKRGRARKPS